MIWKLGFPIERWDDRGPRAFPLPSNWACHGVITQYASWESQWVPVRGFYVPFHDDGCLARFQPGLSIHISRSSHFCPPSWKMIPQISVWFNNFIMCTSCEQSSASLTSSGISLPSGAQGLAGCKDESRGSSRSLVSFSVQVTTMGHPVVLSVLPWHEKRCIRDYIILEDEPATQSGERLHFFFIADIQHFFQRKSCQ